MRTRHALIFGVSGQDGSYAAELLGAKGYRVTGATRAIGTARERLAVTGAAGIELRDADLRSTEALTDLIAETAPDEIYNFAAYSTGAGMYEDPVSMAEINGLAVTRILEAIKASKRPMRFCQASSAEMFRGGDESPQAETTRLAPVSPYAAAKVFAHHCIGSARRRDGVFACSAILYNHESPRRSVDFLSRKVTRAAAEISLGRRTTLELGSLCAQRDWGHAKDAVRGMHLMLQQDEPRDFVLATGATHSVEDLCELAFRHVGLDWRDHVRVDPALVRSPETTLLVGDPSQARKRLSWYPEYTFEDTIIEMVQADLNLLAGPEQDQG